MIDLVGNRKEWIKTIIFFASCAVFLVLTAWSLGIHYWGAETILEMPCGILVFSFAGCSVLIVVAKIILTPILQRDEDYYRKGDDDPDA